MNAAKRREIFARLQAANPQPTTELEYDTPFQLLIAVLLSAQATDKSVNIATRKFFPRYGTRRRCWRWARKACPITSRPSACTAPRPRTPSPPAAS